MMVFFLQSEAKSSGRNNQQAAVETRSRLHKHAKGLLSGTFSLYPLALATAQPRIQDTFRRGVWGCLLLWPRLGPGRAVSSMSAPRHDSAAAPSQRSTSLRLPSRQMSRQTAPNCSLREGRMGGGGFRGPSAACSSLWLRRPPAFPLHQISASLRLFVPQRGGGGGGQER